MYIRISLGIKFQLKLTILIFWTKFALKGCFRSKTEKVNTIIELWLLELVQVPNFSLNWQFWLFLDQIYPKQEFPKIRTCACVLACLLVTYYIELFCTEADRHDGILVSLLLLVAETKMWTAHGKKTFFELPKYKALQLSNFASIFIEECW